MDTKHINVEQIVALLEGSLSKSLTEEYVNHIQKCDSCFLNYSQYSLSHNELSITEFEVTPDQLFEDVVDEFSLSAKRSRGYTWKLMTSALHGLRDSTRWSEPKRIVEFSTIGIAAAAVLIFVGNYLITDKVPSSIDLESFKQVPSMRSTGNISGGGLKVFFDDDTLKIQQPIQINRNIIVYDSQNTPIYRDTISGLRNIISLPKSSEEKKYFLEISTFDSVVWKGEINQNSITIIN